MFSPVFLLQTIWDKLVNGPIREPIFFLHVPKCGGTSIDRSMRWRYRFRDFLHSRTLDAGAAVKVVSLLHQGDDAHTEALLPATLQYREELLLYFLSQKDNTYISGHFAFSDLAYSEYSEKYAFVTVLRDPVEMWISNYFFMKHRRTGEDVWVRNVDIETFMASDFGKACGTNYVRFLTGEHVHQEQQPSSLVDRAKSNLDKFAAVGILEDLEKFRKDFELRFGVRLRIPKVNTSPLPQPERDRIVTDAVRKQIHEICAQDMEIYQYARDRVEYRKVIQR